MKLFALIPARGGSKGIPKKNLVDLNGKPLIDYTLEVLNEGLKQKIIDDYLISTDDPSIATHCKNLGFSVPFLRPDKFATDQARTIDLVLNLLENHPRLSDCDALLLLQVTSPFRVLADIEHSITLMDENPAEDSLISVYEEDFPGLDYFYYADSIKAMPVSDSHSGGIPRQNKPNILVRNGAIYLTRIPFLRREKKFNSDRPLYLKMPKNRSINIDTYDDLDLARAINLYMTVDPH